MKTINYLALGMCISLIAFAASEAQAADKIDMKYDISLRVARIMSLNLDATISNDGYKLATKIKSTGFAKMFKTMNLKMATGGKFSQDKLKPQSYNYKKKKKGKDKLRTVTWQGSEKPQTKRNSKLKERTKKQLKTTLNGKVLDPLSAIFHAGMSADGAPCRARETVYDGKYIYELKFSFVKTEKLDDKKANAYRGTVAHCKMTYLPVAGVSEKKLAKQRANPSVYDVWYATVKLPESGRKMLVPVAAKGKIKERDFTVHARKAKISGKDLSSFAMTNK